MPPNEGVMRRIRKCNIRLNLVSLMSVIVDDETTSICTLATTSPLYFTRRGCDPTHSLYSTKEYIENIEYIDQYLYPSYHQSIVLYKKRMRPNTLPTQYKRVHRVHRLVFVPQLPPVHCTSQEEDATQHTPYTVHKSTQRTQST